MNKSLWEIAAERKIPESETARIVAILIEEGKSPPTQRSPETQQTVTQYWKKLVGKQEEK